MGESNPKIENPKSKIQNHPTWRRKAVTAALVVYWIALFTATHVPRIPRELDFNVSDKWEHYVAYAILGFLLALRWSMRGSLSWRPAALLWAITIAYGAFDETTQPLVGRNADLLDWRADIVGSATGIALYAVVTGAKRFIERRTGSK